MAAHHIRLVGGFVMWIFKGFKTPLKSCINDYTYSFIIGVMTILIVAFLCFNFYEDFKCLFSNE